MAGGAGSAKQLLQLCRNPTALFTAAGWPPLDLIPEMGATAGTQKGALGTAAGRIRVDLDASRVVIREVDEDTWRLFHTPCTRRTDAHVERISSYLVGEGLGWFVRLPEPLRLSVSRWLHLEKFPRGEVVHEQGDDSEWLHIVLSGSVGMYHKLHYAQHGDHSMEDVHKERHDHPLGDKVAEFVAGYVTGETGMFSSHSKEEFSCEATRDSMVLKIGMTHLRDIFPIEARLAMQHSVWVKQYNSAASDREVLDELYVRDRSDPGSRERRRRRSDPRERSDLRERSEPPPHTHPTPPIHSPIPPSTHPPTLTRQPAGLALSSFSSPTPHSLAAPLPWPLSPTIPLP